MIEYTKIILRTIAIFFLLMIIIRLLGKREVGQLSIFDLVILLIIADIASLGIDNSKMFLASILCLFLLLGLQKLFAHLLLTNASLRDFIDGTPKVLIMNGEIMYKALKKEKYTIDDLINQIRIEGVMDIDEIRLAILETSGKLSVFSKERYKKALLPVIVSGRIDKNSLKVLNMRLDYLNDILNKSNYRIKDIIYAVSDGINLISIKFRTKFNHK